ncbi:hypothetical protein GUITHDRAFT_48381, partial [Guillardia theta CCMP2712]
GAYFATSHGDHTIRIISVLTGQTIAVLEGHTRTPWTLRFHRLQSNLLVSGCLNGDLKVWDIHTQTCLRFASLGTERVTSVAFHPEKFLIAASCGRELFFWDISV